MAASDKKDPDAVDESSRVLPAPNPPELAAAAEALPERDAVEKAHKAIATADNHGELAKAQAKLVDESRDAADTPSGGAVKEVAGVKDDRDRGEQYEQEKRARRWG